MMLLPIPPKYRCSWLAPEKCWLVPIGSGFSALSDSYVGMYRRDAARMPGYSRLTGAAIFAPTGRTLKRPLKQRALLFFARAGNGEPSLTRLFKDAI
jgi:hypothetical protein